MAQNDKSAKKIDDDRFSDEHKLSNEGAESTPANEKEVIRETDDDKPVQEDALYIIKDDAGVAVAKTVHKDHAKVYADGIGGTFTWRVDTLTESEISVLPTVEKLNDQLHTTNL